MKSKVIGVGLNKTATKSLAQCFKAMGYRNKSYCLESFRSYRKGDFAQLFEVMDQYDSFEDWPWPLMYKEIDQQYPDARFVLTTRASADDWYRSLCKMAVRMGPMRQFEKHIYGSSMPHGRRDAHIAFYHQHNEAVRKYFADRPGKLLEICFSKDMSIDVLTDFLGEPACNIQLPHENESAPVYGGDVLWKAHGHRIVFQSRWYARQWSRPLRRRLRQFIRPGSQS